MTNTYDTSNFLPCPFCGAAPEAIDWPGGPMAKVFIHCPNDKYDSEDGGCSVGPDVVGSDMEHAAARWNRRAQVPDDLPPVPYNEHEKKLLKEIESRDYWEEKATELAERVGEYFGFDVGEHSNANCPVQTALEAEWQPPQAAVPEGYVAIGKSDLVTRREYGETADEASEKMERTGFYTYEIKELYALQPAPAAVPEFLLEMSRQMREQPNRITAHPFWQVRCNRYLPTMDGYNVHHYEICGDEGVIYRSDRPLSEFHEFMLEEHEEWCKSWAEESHPDDDWREAVELWLDLDCGDLPEGLTKIPVQEVEEVVTTHLTQSDAEWFIRRKQHDYPKLYTYVESAYWSPQLRKLQDWIISLTASPHPAETEEKSR